MTDLEMTRLCAETMNIDLPINFDGNKDCWSYDPLHDDAQAMALVKALFLRIERRNARWGREPPPPSFWIVRDADRKTAKFKIENKDLNRAIVECVAKMRGDGEC